PNGNSTTVSVLVPDTTYLQLLWWVCFHDGGHPGDCSGTGNYTLRKIVLNGTGRNPFAATTNNYFGWLSKRTISGADYVYCNYTNDFFSTVNSTQVAHFDSSLVYSIVLPPVKGSVPKVWVTAGSPGTDAAVYESPDGGAHFAQLNLPAIASGGGVLDLPFTL